jgi:hypothetical protein
MDPAFKKITLGLVILSALLLAAGLMLYKFFFPGWYFGFFPLLVVTFLFVNTVFFIFFSRALSKSDNKFVRSFMVSTAIKLLLYFVLILAYVLTSPETAIPFAVALSMLYIAYTAYDLFVMLTLLKRKKEKNALPDQL